MRKDAMKPATFFLPPDIVLVSDKPTKHLLHSVGQQIYFEYEGRFLEFEIPLIVRKVE
jgi:hypothetical protein